MSGLVAPAQSNDDDDILNYLQGEEAPDNGLTGL